MVEDTHCPASSPGNGISFCQRARCATRFAPERDDHGDVPKLKLLPSKLSLSSVLFLGVFFCCFAG